MRSDHVRAKAVHRRNEALVFGCSSGKSGAKCEPTLGDIHKSMDAQRPQFSSDSEGPFNYRTSSNIAGL